MIANNNKIIDKEKNKFILGWWVSPSPIDKLWKWYKQAGLNEVTIFPACEEEKGEEVFKYLTDSLDF